MTEPVDPLGVIRELLVRYAGGFLRNVRWIPGVTCELCAGIPGEGYSTCYSCQGWLTRTDLSDRLGLVTYAYRPHQSGQVMYGYKDARPAPAIRV
jgi:hypothetical protein